MLKLQIGHFEQYPHSRVYLSRDATTAYELLFACLLCLEIITGTCDAQFTTSNYSYVAKPKICENGGSGTFFPPSEGTSAWDWNSVLLGFLYGTILAYLFVGVAGLADAFMDAIETITSQEKIANAVDTNEGVIQYNVRIWNPTVANLTLMALGSSAPEIILSIIEVIGNDFYAGDLGPGTIVGSAAFNLFVIIAICCYAVGGNGSKHIESYTVFLITAFFAVFAYVWVIIILEWLSPNVVEIWEAVVTVLLMPLLVGLAYAADKMRSKNKIGPDDTDVITLINAASGDATQLKKDNIQQKYLKIRKDLAAEGNNVNVEAELVANVLELQGKQPTRAYYRRMAKTQYFGHKGVTQRHGRFSSIRGTVSKTYSEVAFKHTAFAVRDTEDKVRN